MNSEHEQQAIKKIERFIKAYHDPSAVFASGVVVLAAIRDVLDSLNLPNSKDIGNAAVLGFITTKQETI